MAFGVTSTGFIAKSLEEILSEIEQAEKDEISSSLNVTSQSPIGQLNGIYAAKLRELWELAQAVNSACSILTASGFALDALAANTGTKRDAASKSIVQLTLTLDPATTVPLGSIAGVPGDGSARFVTLAAVTNGGGSSADFTVNAEAEEVGPVVANAGTITSIITPVAGWTAVTNVEDATVGALAQTDPGLRAKQKSELGALGCGTVDALRAELLKKDGIQSVTVTENSNSCTVNGIPPYSISAVIFDGATPVCANDDVAQVIQDSKPMGTNTFGATSGNATDSEGNTHVINFDRAASLDIYLEIDITVGGDFPADGADLIKTAVAAWGDSNLGVADVLVLSQLCSPVFGVTGVIDIVGTRVGTAPSPVQTTNYVPGAAEIVDLDTGRIVVNIIP